MNRTLRLSLLAATAAVLAVAAPAAAQQGKAAGRSAPGRGGQMLSLWAVLDPGPIDGIGFGGRVMFPLVPEGVLHHPRIRDEFTLEVGGDFVHYEDRVGLHPAYVDYSWNGFLAVVGGTWNFWLTPDFALYPKIDLGWWFGWYSGWDDRYGYGRGDFDGLFLQGALGIVYRLRTVSLRAELGSGLLRLGVGFAY